MEKQGFERTKFPCPLLLGHRGTGVGPGENTLAALAEAVRIGADGVELDVRRTRDGALALHHDPELAGLGAVADLEVDQLPAHVPLLEAALDLLVGHLVNIEVKNLPSEAGHDPAELTARAVAGLLAERRYRDNVIVSAFTASTLDAVVAADTDIRTGFLTTQTYDQSRALARVVERGWSALHAHHGAVTQTLVEEAHARGVQLNTWTVNQASRIAQLADWGVDAIITDHLGEAIAACAGREG